MLVQEVSSCTHLDPHQLTRELEMDQSLAPFSLDEVLVPLVSVQTLPPAECRAHWVENQEHRLFFRH